MQTGQKMEMWLKEKCVSGHTCLLYCIVPGCRVSLLRGCALSCAVSSRSTLCHIPGAFESEELPAVWACVCVCLWGPGMKPTATASSDLMQKAAGSSTIHYSLCASSLSPVIMVSPVTKHFVTLGRKPCWGLGCCWGAGMSHAYMYCSWICFRQRNRL